DTVADTMLTPGQVGIPFYCSFVFLAGLYGKPCLLYSVGVGPVFSEYGKQLTRLAFEGADFATVRDEQSRQVLSAIGSSSDRVRVTTDPGFMLPEDKQSSKEILTRILPQPRHPLIGVCLRYWDINAAPEFWQKEVARALDQFIDAYNASAIFIPFQN